MNRQCKTYLSSKSLLSMILLLNAKMMKSHSYERERCYIYNELVFKKKKKGTGTESRTEVAKGLGRVRVGELVFNAYKVSTWEDENVLELDGSDDCATS